VVGMSQHTEKSKEVIIVGAGVVGLVTAEDLARKGVEVTVYDSKRRVEEGANKASGILSNSGLQETGLEYDNAKVNVLRGAVLHAGKEMLKVKSKKDMAFVLDREKLVRTCFNKAREAGARIILNRRVSKEELKVWSNEGKIIVGADGPVSTVASTFGFPQIGEYVLTYKKEYENAFVEDKEMVGLFFNSRIYRFFGWSVPYSESKVELGIGISSRAKKSSTKAFEEFTNEEMVSKIIKDASAGAGYASIIPLSTREKTVIGNVLLVGDAAGQVKATTGGGIIFGALCAKEASNAISASLEHDMPLDNYEKLWRKRYGRELKRHAMLHEYYSSLSTKGFERLFKMARLFGIDDFLSNYGDMDRPGRIIKRFFLRGLAK